MLQSNLAEFRGWQIFTQIRQKIFKCFIIQICCLFFTASETFDVSHIFLPLTITELSTLKQVRFFWPTLYKLTDPSNWHWIWCIHICQTAPPAHMAAAVRVANVSILKGGTQVWRSHMRNSLNAREEGVKFKLVETKFNADSYTQAVPVYLYFGIQGHPRSLLSVPIKSQCRTSY